MCCLNDKHFVTMLITLNRILSGQVSGNANFNIKLVGSNIRNCKNSHILSFLIIL